MFGKKKSLHNNERNNNLKLGKLLLVSFFFIIFLCSSHLYSAPLFALVLYIVQHNIQIIIMMLTAAFSIAVQKREENNLNTVGEHFLW